VRQAYLFVSLVLIAAYPLMPTTGRNINYLVVSISATPAVVVGLRAIPPSRRLPWKILLSALVLIDLAGVLRLVPNEAAFTASLVLDASGNAMVLIAALTQILRYGSGSIGSIVDSTIVALALGGLLWEAVLLPRLAPPYDLVSQRLNLFVVTFALCGVLGALVRLMQVSTPPPRALWFLLAALGAALVGNILYAVGPQPWHRVAASMLFMAAFVAIGLFGLEPSARQIAQPSGLAPPDELSTGRLVFLGAAVAAIPVVVGILALTGARSDGMLLAFGGSAVAALVMVRIWRLSVARDRAEGALRFEATHDPLTGLSNRREFVDQLSTELRNSPRCVIFFCDLDGFKSVNDRLGHDAGDELLIEVGQRLRACVRRHDLVSRFGGDEFLILLRDQALPDVAAIRDRIADALARPIRLHGQEITVGASIGIASGDRDAETLIRRADRAMYEAKRDETAAPGVRIVAA
jgi:diguanylate cyclase (GGDEF)-like protein